MAASLVHTFKWGIFDVAYEVPKRSFVPGGLSLTFLRNLHKPSAYTWRFLKDVYKIAPGTFLAYIASSAWLSISPAVSLQFSYIILQKVCNVQP